MHNNAHKAYFWCKIDDWQLSQACFLYKYIIFLSNIVYYQRPVKYYHHTTCKNCIVDLSTVATKAKLTNWSFSVCRPKIWYHLDQDCVPLIHFLVKFIILYDKACTSLLILGHTIGSISSDWTPQQGYHLTADQKWSNLHIFPSNCSRPWKFGNMPQKSTWYKCMCL